MSDKEKLLETIDWDVPLPDDDELWVPILSPKPQTSVRGLVVSPKLIKVNTHFIGNRTIGCTGEANACEGCSRNLAKRWKGYLAVWVIDIGRYMLAELTKNAADTAKAVLFDPDKNLRGYTITLKRPGKKPNAPVVVELHPPPARGAVEPPADIDVRKALLKIWSQKRRLKQHEAEDEGPEEIPT